MRQIDITRAVLFDNLLQTDAKDNYYLDIHNDYNVYTINYSKDELILSLKSSELKELKIVFKDVEFILLNILLNDYTIDNLYRGRFEHENKLHEQFEDKYCFYIDFDLGSQINFLCKNAYIIFE